MSAWPEESGGGERAGGFVELFEKGCRGAAEPVARRGERFQVNACAVDVAAAQENAGEVPARQPSRAASVDTILEQAHRAPRRVAGPIARNAKISSGFGRALAVFDERLEGIDGLLELALDEKCEPARRVRLSALGVATLPVEEIVEPPGNVVACCVLPTDLAKTRRR